MNLTRRHLLQAGAWAAATPALGLGSGLLAAGPAAAQGAAGGPTWRHGLSLFGEVKYPPDFRRFDYVNPDAPKGGAARQIVYRGENQIYSKHDPTFHAEAGLLRRFFEETAITDLREYTLYSSCEPCFLCCGAMVWARLGRLVYGASDRDLCALLGETGSDCCELVFGHSGWKPQVTGGVCRDESLRVLAAYFGSHEKG